MQTPLGRRLTGAATPAAAASAAIGSACRADLSRDLGVRRTGADLTVLSSSPTGRPPDSSRNDFFPISGRARALPDSQRNIKPLSLRKYNPAIPSCRECAVYI